MKTETQTQIKFFGNHIESVAVTDKGVFLIQSPDMLSEYEELDEIPNGMKLINPSLIDDDFVPDGIK
jgi:hypothetical protein